MVQVAPSILAADFANLERDCRRVVSRETPYLHFDVMDGVFVPNISVGVPVLRSLARALPEAIYDVHLMITDPARYVDDFAGAGAGMLTFHVEAASPVADTLRRIRACGVKAGLSLRPGTPVEALLPYLDQLDHILVMSVEPGFGGQAFMPQAVERIAWLRQAALERGLQIVLEVDGGIDPQTAPACVAAGVDILVAGSAVFGASDPAAALHRLRAVGEKESL